MTEPKHRVQAVDIACEILDALRQRDSAGVTEIADELGYAKSAVHTQLATLEANELVVKEDSAYRLGLQFLDMAEHVKDRIGKYDVITSEVDSLAEETGEVVQFATEEHGWLVYLYKAKGETGVETASSVGKREYLHSTGLGKAILSQYPAERVERIVDRRGLPAKTEDTVTEKGALLEALAACRERGYAVDDEENIPGLRCIAVPVSDGDGGVLGALSISGPSRRITRDRIEDELEEAISKSANVVEINYKFS